MIIIGNDISGSTSSITSSDIHVKATGDVDDTGIRQTGIKKTVTVATPDLALVVMVVVVLLIVMAVVVAIVVEVVVVVVVLVIIIAVVVVVLVRIVVRVGVPH
jgi:hypothetical protein